MVDRYKTLIGSHDLETSEHGDWVDYADYEALEAKLAALVDNVSTLNAEIDRQRFDIAKIKSIQNTITAHGAYTAYETKIEGLENKIARLRTALSKIADWRFDFNGDTIDAARTVAAEALAPAEALRESKETL